MSLRYALLVLGIGILAAGCASSATRAPALPTGFVQSGFLSDYGLLQPASGDEAGLEYRNADADFSKYDKILFHRVHIWRDKEEGLDDIEEDGLQRLADELYLAIRSKLEKDYAIVEESDDAAIKIHMALTDVSGANVVLDTFSTTAPPSDWVPEAADVNAATHAFLRSAVIEIEIEDPSGNQSLVAAIDQRLGRKPLNGSLDSWNGVAKVFGLWADGIAAQLAKARARKR